MANPNEDSLHASNPNENSTYIYNILFERKFGIVRFIPLVFHLIAIERRSLTSLFTKEGNTVVNS